MPTKRAVSKPAKAKKVEKPKLTAKKPAAKAAASKSAAKPAPAKGAAHAPHAAKAAAPAAKPVAAAKPAPAAASATPVAQAIRTTPAPERIVVTATGVPSSQGPVAASARPPGGDPDADDGGEAGSLLAGPRNVTPYITKRGEAYMNSVQLEHFRNILNGWKRDLMEEVDRTVSHMKDEAANFPTRTTAPRRKRNSASSCARATASAS
jgi:DnaK suppressor protein